MVFFCCRNVFQTWVILTKFGPAFARDNYSFDKTTPMKFLSWYLIALYFSLLALNCFWFYKIFMMTFGAVKSAVSSKKPKKA